MTDPPDVLRGFRKNPFWTLQATPRDDRRRIVELAQERLLTGDGEEIRKARSTLTSPRARLTAELSWLPGLSPGRADQLLNLLEQEPEAVQDESGVPALSRANLLAAALQAMGSDDEAPTRMASTILDLARAVQDVSAEDVLRDINGDRSVAGFPAVPSVQQVEQGLSQRQRALRESIRASLDVLPSSVVVGVMIRLLEEATAGGRRHPPKLIVDTVHQYDLAATPFLESEANNVRRLMAAARRVAGEGGERLSLVLSELESVVRNWDRVAQPVQLAFQPQGKDHHPSVTLANEIRALAVELVNEHGQLEESRRLIRLVEGVFAELPEVVEQSSEDHQALDELFRGRRELDAAAEEWARKLRYSVDLGGFFGKKMLTISPDGVSWKGRGYPLEEVTRVRWGATRHSVNGIPTGTSYTIAFGDEKSEAIAEFRNEEAFSEFVQRLYMGVGVRLLTRLLEDVRDGFTVEFGRARVRDHEVILPRRGLFSGPQIACGWDEVEIWSRGGYFGIQALEDKKAHVELSYIVEPNTHILEHAIRMTFKKGGLRLSELLSD